MRASMISAALVAALVGFGSTIALLLAAAAAVGATPAQTASWIFAICLMKAIGSAGLSLWARVPMVLAWSTPGAALIAATQGISMAQAAGAFVIAGLLVMATGAFRPLGRLVALIPDAIAAAMLAGVLLPFCLKLPAAVQDLPTVVLPMIVIFLAVRLWNPAIAVLAALGLGIAIAVITGVGHAPDAGFDLPALRLIAPQFDMATLMGLAIPLYLVTMASQNLPGFATLRAAGYEPPVPLALLTTGALSAIGGLFGAHTVNMAAITAAICLGPDVHPDRAERWKVGLIYAAFWVVLGLTSPLILAILANLPPALITALVALALLGPLTGALSGAFTPVPDRFAAAVTLTTAASGVIFHGIGGAFWGLLAGLAVHAASRLKPQ